MTRCTCPPRPSTRLATAVCLALLGTTLTQAAPAGSKAEAVRSMNAEVLQLQAAQRRNPNATLNARATRALAERSRLLQALIASDPGAATALAFPADVLAGLAASFPAAKGSLERRGRWQGELEYLIEDDASMAAHRSIFKLHGQGEVLDVRFAGGEPPGLRSGRKFELAGLRVGRSVAVNEAEQLDAAQDGTVNADAGSTYPATCAPTGAQSVLSILVNLPGYTLPSAVTADFVRGMLLGNAYSSATSTPDWSVDDFWRQNSDGRTYVDPANTTVVGPINLASNFNTDANGASYCDNYGLRDAVMKQIDSQVDFKRYSRIQIVMPANGACSWAGTANLGCRSLSTAGDGSFTASVAWQRADTMQSRSRAVQLSTHELGHNLGLHHASSRDFGAEALGGLGAAGTLSEYGDTHSTMGSWNLGFYASSHLANTLGWLGSNTNFRTVESAGTYTIQNYEARPAGMKALKVRRGTGNDAWLWIESRQNTGIYSSQLNSTLFTGALIHYQDSTTGSKSHLLDFTTATSGFGDAALPVGETWTDPYSNLSVTVNSVTAGAMTVSVNYGGVTCTAAAPTVSVSPTSASLDYGGKASLTVTVKNNSSSGCATESFPLAASVPSGWSASFASSSLSVSPGQQAQAALSVGVPSPYALGTYAVGVSAQSADTGKAGSASANLTVTEPVNTLAVALSSGGQVALSNPAKTCTSNCSTDYTGSLAGASVTLSAVPVDSTYTFTGWSGACSGTATNCTVTMSADRSVTANFKAASTSKKGGGSGGGGGGKPPK
jgi:M6 family metalloprotease-like protein/uncharacterized repeat protein (TIGR02543 family)